jgi:hypothetical protein
MRGPYRPWGWDHSDEAPAWPLPYAAWRGMAALAGGPWAAGVREPEDMTQRSAGEGDEHEKKLRVSAPKPFGEA